MNIAFRFRVDQADRAARTTSVLPIQDWHIRSRLVAIARPVARGVRLVLYSGAAVVVLAGLGPVIAIAWVTALSSGQERTSDERGRPDASTGS